MENQAELKEIYANEVTIEVTDRQTGLKFSRTLPIDYYETANCLRLRGENASGDASELVFLSSAGLGHLRDMTGQGPDKDPCGGHSGK